MALIRRPINGEAEEFKRRMFRLCLDGVIVDDSVVCTGLVFARIRAAWAAMFTVSFDWQQVFLENNARRFSGTHATALYKDVQH